MFFWAFFLAGPADPFASTRPGPMRWWAQMRHRSDRDFELENEKGREGWSRLLGGGDANGYPIPPGVMGAGGRRRNYLRAGSISLVRIEKNSLSPWFSTDLSRLLGCHLWAGLEGARILAMVLWHLEWLSCGAPVLVVVGAVDTEARPHVLLQCGWGFVSPFSFSLAATTRLDFWVCDFRVVPSLDRQLGSTSVSMSLYLLFCSEQYGCMCLMLSDDQTLKLG